MGTPAVDMRAVRRVLIIKMSAMGDVIHALPVAAALYDAFPHVELTWAVEEPFAPLVSGNPCVSRTLLLPKMSMRLLHSAAFRRDYRRRLRALQTFRFDLTLDLQGLTKSAIVARATGARVRLGYHRLREAARLFEKPVPCQSTSVHIVDQYLDVARFLGADPQIVRFPFAIPDEEEATASDLLCTEGIGPDRPFVAINPASAADIKQWPAANYAALIDSLHDDLDLPSVLVTADTAVARHVRALSHRPFVDLSGRTNLKQLAAVLQRSKVHVCGDTGSGHLAAALGRPVVSLIGPTDPDRVCPYGQRANVLSHREACGESCRWHHCQFKQPHCLAAIAVAEVQARIRALLSAEGRTHRDGEDEEK